MGSTITKQTINAFDNYTTKDTTQGLFTCALSILQYYACLSCSTNLMRGNKSHKFNKCMYFNMPIPHCKSSATSLPFWQSLLILDIVGAPTNFSREAPTRDIPFQLIDIGLLSSKFDQ